ncbi:DUF3987 domain-containing protein [Pedobacter sp. Leaf170]|uniref:DUF3987 domain-containing protein n=1 Tax=Pedobacter sp. Leaf170 TaxID=2876558 RepID=UPI001E3F18D0|nr:DUF3987 domain-containing protein [Pedobacter sp. Leaf170]
MVNNGTSSLDLLNKLKSDVSQASMVEDSPENESILFPLEAFPEEIREIVLHYNKFKSYPIDFFACSILAAVGSAVGNSHIMQTNDGYENKANIFIANVAQRGINKTSPTEEAYKPIVRKQNENYKFQKADFDRMIADKASEKEQKKAKKLKDEPKCTESVVKVPNDEDWFDAVNESVTDESVQSAQSAIKENKFIHIRPLLNEATPEVLIHHLTKSSRGVTIVYDELAGFLKAFNKYNKGNDEQMYLSLWQGNAYNKDTFTHGTQVTGSPFLSVIGTIQPTVLAELFKEKTENGFFDRFLICYLTDVKKPYPSMVGVDPLIINRYVRVIDTLQSLWYSDTQKCLKYTREASQIIFDAVCKSIDIENDISTSEVERGVRAKLIIYIHKLALIMQLLEYGISGNPDDKNQIGVTSAKSSVLLFDYFLKMAIKARLKSRAELLTGSLKTIYSSLPNEKNFSTADFVRVCSQFMEPRGAKKLLANQLDKLWTKVSHGSYSKIE